MSSAAALPISASPLRLRRLQVSEPRRGGSRAVRTVAPPRAAPSDGRPRGRSEVVVVGDGSDEWPAVRTSRLDLVEDIRAQMKALARAADAPVYSADRLDYKYRSRPLEVVRRALEVLIALGSFAMKLLLDKKGGRVEQNKRKRGAEFRMMFTRLGPTFVKIGQALSTRPDLCPPEYLSELSELQNALPTFPDAEAFECIERELGQPLDTIFSSISASPIAAASLGQVYKARLRHSRQVVAVKVQRPGIEEVIGLDFHLIRSLGFLINKYVDMVTTDVVALVDEFGHRVYQELNYVQEGRNARRFKILYADKQDIIVPDIFWDYTSAKVLTMEWVDGVKLSDLEAIERQGLNVLELVTTGVECTLRQLLEYGYFHADPHPGNLLATPSGKLAFLDFGMMSETPEKARFAIIGHVVHLVNRDYEAMARDYYALEFLSPDVDVSPIVPALQNLFDDALSATVSELNFKTIVDGLDVVFYQFPFKVPAYYALILRSLTVLEGLAICVDPNFKALAASYPYFAKRLLTDPNPYLRDALVELLFKDGRFRWNRLQNLLEQGRKDRDFSAKEALQPVLQLLVGPEGEELRVLVIEESVHIVEAIILSSAVDAYKSIPDYLRIPLFIGNLRGLAAMRDGELESMTNLRDQILQQPEAHYLGVGVLGGVMQRLAARMLQQLLQTSPSATLPASTSQ
ncbi:hypothetical protein CDL15_Pgr012207 [Punica granatum]|uniref:Protein kinase domain-containing protein n=1 Tax=Punica granatum TaxID=22663 RepID=A0A218XLU0_PUNGR|nr:hypothetical protein CDL15_Pgr012207 [Punica granatum]